MTTSRPRTRAIGRRLAGISLALALMAALAPGASWAVTPRQLDAARAKVTALRHDIADQQAVLDDLSARTAAQASRLSAAQTALEMIAQQLLETRIELAQVRERLQEIQARLDERARQTYIGGPGSSIEFLLGATSLIDLSDRLEFLDSVTQTDAALASEVQSTKDELVAKQYREEDLQAEQSRIVTKLRRGWAELNAQFETQKQVYDDIQAKEAEAERLAQKLGKRYQAQLSRQFGGPIGDGPIGICPVGQPHGVGNDFGAPRYAGGYHPHAGNDIFAPEGTPIYAPFDGVAKETSNGLGGNAVSVYGADGYVYNAHLSAFGKLGPVHVGDVVGFVGNTGDAQGGATHDHFEWHPKVIPSKWPASPYGDSVLGNGAINPYPLLSAVC